LRSSGSTAERPVFGATPQITNAAQAKALGYDAFIQGPNAKMNADKNREY